MEGGEEGKGRGRVWEGDGIREEIGEEGKSEGGGGKVGGRQWGGIVSITLCLPHSPVLLHPP